jgi:hypothetical protein
MWKAWLFECYHCEKNLTHYPRVKNPIPVPCVINIVKDPCVNEILSTCVNEDSHKEYHLLLAYSHKEYHLLLA